MGSAIKLAIFHSEIFYCVIFRVIFHEVFMVGAERDWCGRSVSFLPALYLYRKEGSFILPVKNFTLSRQLKEILCSLLKLTDSINVDL